ncbi:hypothetical protein [Methanobrevibacter sp. DSM 116169]|uniref:carboxypeptidase-like regulatory domain-containing protein n=1 Tax=Methanobrevibacter sp. DSM 116169 TaxID=3242727 RepID=UPI0038FC1756
MKNYLKILLIASLILFSIGGISAEDTVIENFDDNAAIETTNVVNEYIDVNNVKLEETITEDNQVFNDTKEETYINSSNIEKTYNDSGRLEATLFDSNGTPISGVNLTIIINGQTYNRPVNDNGTLSMAINLEPGFYPVEISFAGNDEYANSSTSINVTVLPTLIGEDLNKTYRNGSQFYIKAIYANGSAIIGKNVSFNINGQKYYRLTNASGIATLNINLAPGVYVLTATNPIDGLNTSYTITVFPTLIGNDLNKTFRNGSQFHVKVINGDGTVVADKMVSMNINGVFYERKTNASGIATLNINLEPGTYILTAKNPVDGLEDSYIITVLSTIFGEDLVKYYKNGSQFHALFINGDGTPIVGKNVTFNINGVMYTRLTNASGIATLNINLDPNSYILTAKNPVDGLEKSFKIFVNSTVIVDKVMVYYESGEHAVAQILDGTGKAAPAGIITLGILGKDSVFIGAIRENGTAYFTFDGLLPGKYDAFVNNPVTNESRHFILTINSTLVTKDQSVVYNEKGQYSVKLVDSNGTALANKTVTITLNGNSYNRTTNENGTAYLTINLRPGTYTVVASYEGLNQTNKLTVNKMPASISLPNGNTISKNGNLEIKATHKGNPIAGITIYVQVDGIDQLYGYKTNAEGIATARIGLPVGSYQFWLMIAQDPNYADVTTINTIKIV